jgi:nucleoside-diphosphate-sugar epimerase
MINIVYTNSKCQDVFNIFKSQHDRYSKLPLFVISDNGRNSDNRLYKKNMNWEPSTELNLGLEKTYEWIKSQYQ